MNAKQLCRFRSKVNAFCVLALVFALCQLPFGVSPVSASSRPLARAVAANKAPLSPAVCPASIGFGETIQCSILSAGEIDIYTFTANAGDKVLVRMSKPSGGALVLGTRIYSSGGTKLCEAYNSVPAEIASCTLPSAGTYSIQAMDMLGTHTGNYYLYLQRLNNPGSTVPIAFGQTLMGSMISPAQMDTYTFTANAGDKVLVRMSKFLEEDIVLETRVYSPDGTKLCQAYNAVPAEIASCTLPSAGTYTILATDLLGNRLGDYSLYLQRLNNPGSPAPIAFGQALVGAMISPAQMDTYTFTANAGDKVLVRMNKPSGGSLVLETRVYGPDGVKLCEAYNAVPAEIASCTLPSAGTYTILATDLLGNRLGDYYLYLQRLNNPGNAVPIGRGQALTGSISTAAEMDTYIFTASAGDMVLVKVSKLSGSLWMGVRLYGPDGTQLCEASSSSTATIPGCSMPSNGSYTILVFDSLSGTYTGDYRLYLDCCGVYLPLVTK
ncbi:MAG: PPC domain-containing protein [Chloroflexota bacterium]